MKITMARKWQDKNTKEIRFFIEVIDDSGYKHSYTRYVTGNGYQTAKSWGTGNGAEGEPAAEIVSEYRRLTDNGRKSYFAPTGTISAPATKDIYEADAVAARMTTCRIVEA